MFRGQLPGLSSRVQPILTRFESVFSSTPFDYTNRHINTAVKTNMAGSIFVLNQYNNVPVTAQGLERDQLTQWAPFMVSTRAENTTNRPPSPTTALSSCTKHPAKLIRVPNAPTELDSNSVQFSFAPVPAYTPLLQQPLSAQGHHHRVLHPVQGQQHRFPQTQRKCLHRRRQKPPPGHGLFARAFRGHACGAHPRRC